MFISFWIQFVKSLKLCKFCLDKEKIRSNTNYVNIAYQYHSGADGKTLSYFCIFLIYSNSVSTFVIFKKKSNIFTFFNPSLLQRRAKIALGQK